MGRLHYLVLVIQCLVLKHGVRCDSPWTPSGEYDFIVVGGGSTGSVIAARLSEMPKWSVLLLEAGSDETFMSQVPSMSSRLRDSNMDWQYKTEPQENACLMASNSQCAVARGKVLGGSSAINENIYSRGNRADFDSWAAQGNPGWSYEEVLPYFLKAEDNWNPYLAVSPYHGNRGPLTVQDVQWKSPLAPAFMSAAESLGYENSDPNGAEQQGFSMIQTTTRRGKRCSSNRAYVVPSRPKGNLYVVTDSLVTKILINPSTNRAYGVEVFHNGSIYTVWARTEIIISAGAINSPQLLMLSGIGPKEHLQDMGIPLYKDLPGVGLNLQDSVTVSLPMFATNFSEIIGEPSKFWDNAMKRYMVEGMGPFTSPSGAEVIGYISTKYNNGSESTPDIEVIMSVKTVTSRPSRSWNSVWKNILDYSHDPVQVGFLFFVTPRLLHPKSRGSVRLRTADPRDKPVINPRYLTEREDMERLVEGLKLAVQLGESPSLLQFDSQLVTAYSKGCDHVHFRSDNYWECMAMAYSGAGDSFSGTCKMGPPNDPNAVVDPELRVYGIEGLRVADSSVMPSVVGGHANAACVMIGEKAADVIKTNYGVPV